MTKERYAQVPMDDDAELKELFEHICAEHGIDAATTRKELKASGKITIPSLQKLGKKLGIKLVFDYGKKLIEGWYTVDIGANQGAAPAAEAPMEAIEPVVKEEAPAIEEPQVKQTATEEPTPTTTEVPVAAPAPPVQGEVPVVTPEAPVAPAAPEAPTAPTPPAAAPVAPPAQPVAPAAAPAEVPGADQSLVQPEQPAAPAAAPTEQPAQATTPPPGGGPAFQTVKDPAVTGENAEDDEPF